MREILHLVDCPFAQNAPVLAIAWLDIEGTFPKAQAADACLLRKPSDSRHYPLINLPPLSLDF